MARPSWVGKMRAVFGGGFLWLVCFIYFTQGFRSFVWTAVSYQLKDILKLSPSASQFLVSAAFFPWSIKPLYGILSDCIPIRGRKRIPYLLLATILSLVPWPLLGSSSFLRSSQIYLTVLLVIQNVGSAMADVVIDAMIAEACRAERAAFAGDLQTLSWSAMAFGGICGSLLGGYTLSHFEISTIFLMFSIFPSIQLLSSAFVHEVPLGSSLAEKEGEHHSDRSLGISDGALLLNGESKMEARYANGDSSLDEYTRRGNLKRRKNSKKNGGKKKGKGRSTKVTSDGKQEKHRSLIMRVFMSLRAAFHSLLLAFRQPAILRPMAWFFLAHITIPNLSTVMFYYQTEVLHLEASFLGTARVVGWFGLMFGTFTYNRYLKRMPLRRILLWAHIGLAFLNSFDIVLVSRKNVDLGISDKYLVLCGSALSDAVNQFKMMPFLILSGQLCPPGIEGTLFALFMSINNLGTTIGSFNGAALASVLNISSNSFDNFLLGVSLQLVATFVPVFFLFLIPKEATGLSA